MRKSFLCLFVSLVIALMLAFSPATACTSLLVTKGASVDGSVMITYTCDGAFHPHMEYLPAADYGPDDSLEIVGWRGDVRGKIKQAKHTYSVVQLMNEHQLVIGETTFDGREELRNSEGVLHYWDLMQLALQRAKTAREAIEVMTSLVDEYGYGSTGESISIADQEEAWILEIIGPGDGGHGAEWVAVRVPDGYISAHANKARIGEFPLDDPENCLYSDNVISFAVEKGYYDPDSGKPFRFCDAYCPATPKNLRWCEARVWSIFRRSAPSREFSADYHRGIECEPYPLWIKPDSKLSVADVFALMRDHYEGTDYDLTQGVDAGPYGCPNRWRPLSWRPSPEDSTGPEYGWERAISTQQTGFSFVSQSRSHLPDPIGGVLWYGLDDTWFTCYTPMYCGINDIPHSFTVGSLSKFSWESAWWVFNFVSNITYPKYTFMAPDVLEVQKEIEGKYLAFQPSVDEAATKLYKSDLNLMTEYLTDYSVTNAEQMVARWKELGEFLLTKYNDGYVQENPGRPAQKGYPESWLRKVLGARADQFLLPERDEATPEIKLVD